MFALVAKVILLKLLEMLKYVGMNTTTKWKMLSSSKRIKDNVNHVSYRLTAKTPTKMFGQ